MFNRAIRRSFKLKNDYLEDSLANAYDFLHCGSYFKMIGNITKRVDLYNSQVDYLQDPKNEERALKYLESLNGNQRYEDAMLFASRWKYKWYQGFTSFLGDGVSRVKVGDNQKIKIRPFHNGDVKKKFRR